MEFRFDVSSRSNYKVFWSFIPNFCLPNLKYNKISKTTITNVIFCLHSTKNVHAVCILIKDHNLQFLLILWEAMVQYVTFVRHFVQLSARPTGSEVFKDEWADLSGLLKVKQNGFSFALSLTLVSRIIKIHAIYSMNYPYHTKHN